MEGVLGQGVNRMGMKWVRLRTVGGVLKNDK